MNKELSDFAARLREIMLWEGRVPRGPDLKNGNRDSHSSPLREFDTLALELFALQFKYNAAYRRICEARGVKPDVIEHWTQIPAVPTAAFKELEFSCIPPEERTAVFYSSGTTEQKPGRHFHCPASMELYETSLWPWFLDNVLPDLRFTTPINRGQVYDLRLICLTPPPEQAPRSSLVHMFETVCRRAGQSADRSFFGAVAADGSWLLDDDAVLAALNSSLVTRHPSLILGTAFSFVHLLDFLGERDLRFQLPPGSRVMETGGYKNRSRTMPKSELHALITERLGVPGDNVICEFGMSELSSQAYDSELERRSPTRRDPVGVRALACSSGTLKRELQHGGSETGAPSVALYFHFPPWARVQIISSETGREVAEGETGLIRVFDLANVFSVLAVQTEDLGVRRGDGFELIGRAQTAEARGCSLMTMEGSASSLP